MCSSDLTAARRDPGPRSLDLDLSALLSRRDRDHAERRLPRILRLQGVRGGAQGTARRLLRVLLVRIDPVPADPARARRRPTEIHARGRLPSRRNGFEVIPFTVLPWTPCSGMFRAIFGHAD